MPMMQVRRADLSQEFFPVISDRSRREQIDRDLVELLEDLEDVCLGEVADCWKDTPDEQQRKLRVFQ